MTVAVPPRPPLDRRRLADGLRARAPGWRAEVLAAAPSTNPLAAARAREGAAEGLVVVAEHQTAGRGRLDRTWVTPDRAALTFSVVLRPAVPDRAWTWLPLVAGLAVVRGVAAAGGPRCLLKWPNDVLCREPEDGGAEERKVAGLLAERVATPAGAAAVVGIGLNVSTTATERPVPAATSLALAGGPVPDRTALLVELLAALHDLHAAWQRDPGPVQEDYRRRCVTLGRRVRADLPSAGVLEGTAVGVDGDGALQVAAAAGGAVTAVSAGDVVHVRAR